MLMPGLRSTSKGVGVDRDLLMFVEVLREACQHACGTKRMEIGCDVDGGREMSEPTVLEIIEGLFGYHDIVHGGFLKFVFVVFVVVMVARLGDEYARFDESGVVCATDEERLWSSV